MYKIGIVGAGKNKFTQKAEITARKLITSIITRAQEDHPDLWVVSGHSPLGGIDLWAEEIAQELGVPTDIKAPEQQSWEGEYGYRARNLDIAESNEVHCIVVDRYPENYHGRRFDSCYHCDRYAGKVTPHVKSGGCWTMHHASNNAIKRLHIIKNKVW